MHLRLQLTLVFGAFIAVILSAVALSVYVLTERSLNVGVEERAQSALSEITRGSDSLQEGLQRLPSDTFYQIVLIGTFDRVRENPASIRAGVPYTIAGFPSSPLVTAMSESALQTLSATSSVVTTVVSGGERIRLLGRLGQVSAFDGRLLPAAFLIGVPAGLMASTLEQLARDLVLTVIVAFLAFALGVWVLADRVLAPLKRVTEAAARISGSEITKRVPVPNGRDEIRDLGVAINNMLDRLQESFETQRRFTADASHELRTPVTAIAGHASYLSRRTNPSPEQTESIDIIRREADRMGKLVNDLLELARADAGFTVQRVPMNLVEVVHAVKAEVTPGAGGAQIEVHAPQPLVEVLGDAGRLKQVVLNLVHNALNAGAKRVSLSVTRAKNQITLEVLDDGSGIPADALPHLFDRFYRVDGARSGRGNGSGLGLAIVKWIVQQHDGAVTVESRLGEGSVFSVQLPALDPRQTEEVDAVAKTSDQATKVNKTHAVS
ncbi:MAG: HAMP domain-containing histidine kinase [Trueperaceae bacterium]|nr:HAMP domain-containing histidine kinase [Trueperaceae bacterium]